MTVYATGCDFAFQHPDYAQLVPGGYVFSVRYLYPPGQGRGTKNLTKWEADTRWSYGNDTVSNYESWASRAGESPAWQDGVDDAIAADTQHKACGGPADRPIYFSVDFDTVAANDPGIGDYFRGIASVIGLNRTGAYGEYEIIKYLFDNNLIKWGWQTYAWSGGQYDERCQLAQDHNGLNFAGGNIDLDTAHAADYGQWHYNGDEMLADERKALLDIQSKINTIILDPSHSNSLNAIRKVLDDPNNPQALRRGMTDTWNYLHTLPQTQDIVNAIQAGVTTAVASAVPVITQAIKDGLPPTVDPTVVEKAVNDAVAANLPAAVQQVELAISLTGSAGPKVVTS